MNFFDIAAGILIGGGLIMGMVWGAKRGGGERPFFWICAALACFIVIWRASVWYYGPDAAGGRAALAAKYDVSEHQ